MNLARANSIGCRRWPWMILLGVLALPLAAMAMPEIPTQFAGVVEDRPVGRSDADERSSRTDVTVSVAGTIAPPLLYQSYRGEIRARRESALAIRRAGKLVEIMVDEGDRIRQGELLARLDTSDLDVRERLADADVDAAEAAANEAVAGPRYQTLRAAAARVRQLKAQLSSAQSRLERQQRLDVRNSGTAQELDDARFDTEELQARLDAAVAELEELNEGTRGEQIEAAKARRRAAIAARQQIDVDRQDSQILAPYDGVIANRYFDEGAMLSPGEPVLRILETDPIEARFGVPADVAEVLKVDDAMTVIVGKKQILARIVRMQPQVDPVTRTRGVDVQLDASEGAAATVDGILVGQTASLQVPATNPIANDFNSSGAADPSRSDATAFWLPTESLVRGSRGLWSIYVAVAETNDAHPDHAPPDDDKGNAKIQRREARVLQTAGQMSLIQGMLRTGELVVTDGAHRIGPGVRVRAHLDSADRKSRHPLAAQPSVAPEH